MNSARVAQLDRVPGYEPGGRRFESFHARHFHCISDYARVAQLDRVPGYEPGGRRFESFHARHLLSLGVYSRILNINILAVLKLNSLS